MAHHPDTEPIFEGILRDVIEAINEMPSGPWDRKIGYIKYIIQDGLDRAAQAQHELFHAGHDHLVTQVPDDAASIAPGINHIVKSSGGVNLYVVTVTRSGEVTCNCPGFTHHGHCYHADAFRSAMGQ